METDPKTEAGQVTRKLRRALQWVLIAGCGVMLVLATSCGACAVAGFRALGEGASFANRTIPTIANPWDAERILKLAAPELSMSSSPNQVRDFIAFVAAQLGSIKTCRDVRNGPFRFHVDTTNGISTFTSHFVECDFEQGVGTIAMDLVRRNSAWTIVSFRVNSDCLFAKGK